MIREPSPGAGAAAMSPRLPLSRNVLGFFLSLEKQGNTFPTALLPWERCDIEIGKKLSFLCFKFSFDIRREAEL